MKKITLAFNHDSLEAFNRILQWEINDIGKGINEKMRATLLTEILIKVTAKLFIARDKNKITLSAAQAFAILASSFYQWKTENYEDVIILDIITQIDKKLI